MRRETKLPRYVKIIPSFVKYPERVAAIICHFTGVGIDRVRERIRIDDVVTSKHLTHYLLSINQDMTFESIAAFSGYDHATVMHGRTVIENLLSYDRDFEKWLSIILLKSDEMEPVQQVSAGPIIELLKPAFDSRKQMYKIMKSSSAGGWRRFGFKWYYDFDSVRRAIQNITANYPEHYAKHTETNKTN